MSQTNFAVFIRTKVKIAMSNRMTSANIKAAFRRTSAQEQLATLTDAVEAASKTLRRFLCSDLAISTGRCLEGRG
jgi:hypothetical protein